MGQGKEEEGEEGEEEVEWRMNRAASILHPFHQLPKNLTFDLEDICGNK